jgi:chitosanase
LASGNLFLLIKAYCDAPAAAAADTLRPFLNRLGARDLSLDNDVTLRRSLRAAGDDVVMHTTQDEFFDRVYWAPAVSSANAISATSALAVGVVYDSTVHGSWRTVRDLTIQNNGPLNELGEEAWIRKYVETRRAWLANHPKPILHNTVYRMDAFTTLIEEKKWELPLPLTIRGVRIDETTFAEPVRASAGDDDDRILKLETPFMVGEDVRAIQRALAARGFSGAQDGIFGPLTEARVRQFQLDARLRADGIVGPATRTALGL